MPMAFDEMIDLVERRIAGHSPYVAKTDRSRPNPRVRITSSDSQDRWAEIELDDEIFFLNVDRGFYLVEAELGAAEQAELLAELAGVAVAYLAGDFHLIEGRSILGRKRPVLRIATAGSEYVLKRR
jgi:hypothetical protein